MGAYLDFKAIAEQIDVGQVARFARLDFKKSGKELRACCPACQSDDERSLALYPETNSFRCFSAQQSGDCISLYAHLTGTGNYAAAKALQEHFLTAHAAGKPATAPQKPEGRTAQAQPAPTEFDPEAFATKLAYTKEVAELGITELDAARLSIGYCSKGLLRGRVAFPIRNSDGTIAGFVGFGDGTLKLPSRWQSPTVVPFKQRA